MSGRILVIDDSPTLAKFVSHSLKSNGYDVLGACDGMDALEKVSHLEGEVDLVITDLKMPNIDGYELIAALRKNARFADTPIIILSSERVEEDKIMGRRSARPPVW